MSVPVSPATAEAMDAGLRALRRHEEEINALNVFPVPDGDTGTNLVMTMQAVCDQLAQTSTDSLSDELAAVTLGSLMGARGNSGVILSQIIRGICDGLGEGAVLDSRSVANLLQNGVRVAYQAIRKPVEGTMLTVIRDAATAAAEAANEGETDVAGVLERVLREAAASVARTPDLLPVLKEAGVVDAGGYGLVVLADGIVGAILDRPEEAAELVGATGTADLKDDADLEYRFCTEFVVRSEGLDSDAAERYLASIGGSVMVAASPRLARVHVHTNEPWSAIEWAAGLGGLEKVKIDDMAQQVKRHIARTTAPGTVAGTGIVAVANGEGVRAILRSLGVGSVVNGGQTMNPSAAELGDAVDRLPQSQVVLLPNNSNIVLTAGQVGQLTSKSVAVVPTKSIPEAFAALLAFEEDADLADNEKRMSEAAAKVKTCEITHAVRSGRSGKVKFSRGDLIGISDGQVRVAGRKLATTAVRLIEDTVGDTDSAVTLVVGDGADRADIDKIAAKIGRKHPHLDVDVQDGGQPLYPLIVGIE